MKPVKFVAKGNKSSGVFFCGISAPIWALKACLLSIFAIGLVACSNEGRHDPESPPVGTVTLSGTVQKGFFSNLSVNAYRFNASGELGDPVSADITADGQGYKVDLDASELVLLEAAGSFGSEIDGTIIELDQPLLAVVDVRENTGDFESNINIATTLEASWILSQGLRLRKGPLSRSGQKHQPTALAGRIQQPVDW